MKETKPRSQVTVCPSCGEMLSVTFNGTPFKCHLDHLTPEIRAVVEAAKSWQECACGDACREDLTRAVFALRRAEEGK